MLQSPEYQPEPAVENEGMPVETKGVIEVSRRTFFTLFSAGCVAGLTAMAPKIFDKLEKESLPDRVRGGILRNKSSILATLGESVVFSGFQMKLAEYLDAMRISHGAQAYTAEQYAEAVQNYPVSEFVQNNLIIPIVEEAIFRLLPSAFLDDDEMHWEVGSVSTVFFCAIHNLGKNEKGITINLTSLPVLQCLLSQYCWYLMRKRGFAHAAAVHMTYNILIRIDECVQQKLMAEFQEEPLSSEQWASYDSAAL